LVKLSNGIPLRLRVVTSRLRHSLALATTAESEEPAPNPQSVFVLNFENWDLQIARAAQALAPRVEFAQRTRRASA